MNRLRRLIDRFNKFEDDNPWLFLAIGAVALGIVYKF